MAGRKPRPVVSRQYVKERSYLPGLRYIDKSCLINMFLLALNISPRISHAAKVFLSCFFILTYNFSAVTGSAYSQKAKEEVCIRDFCFSVEIAKTTSERARGLMFRERLAKETGMYFLFEEEGYYPFWMKNTLIPLDIVWINKESEIVVIKKDLRPCREDVCPTIEPDGKAMYVLEINGGMADEIGAALGDKA
ncbi:MAG: DUF192 domain-containing protein, partial [Candidatus Omnitrophota bacterium]